MARLQALPNLGASSVSTAAAKIQAVLDLLWAVNSSPLVRQEGQFDLPLPALQANEIDADLLSRILAARSDHRVGHYFEALIGFYLQHVRGFEMVAQGRQVRQRGQTLGELDFVFHDDSGELQHWETAVKFYLHRVQNHATKSHLIGPNPADNFENKIHRLTAHQLPMVRRDFPDIASSKALLRGRIFYHVSHQTPDAFNLPAMLSPSHIRSLWCYESEWPDFVATQNTGTTRLHLAMKPYWLSDVVVADETADHKIHSLTVDDLRQHFEQSTRPLLICLLEPFEDVLRERSRIFVVHNSWPE